MLSLDIKRKIKKTIRGNIKDSPEILEKYSRDASIFEIKPEVVVYPKNVRDLKRLVTFAAENPEVSLTARSGGTDMTGGPLGQSVILDMTAHFDKVLKVGADYAISQPGVYYRDFEKKTLKRGLLLPSYPASREICTVGGMVANNAGGEKSLAYGKTEDYLNYLKAVLSDGEEYLFKPLTKAELDQKLAQKDFEGEIYRKIFDLIGSNYDLLKRAKPNVSKNSAGYYLWNVWDRQSGIFDLTRLLVGSQGTLGIITEISFRLIRPKKHSKLLVIFLPDLRRLVETVNLVLRQGPESFESFDDHTLKLAMRYFGEIAKSFGTANLLKLAWQFRPELWMFITGGTPKLILMAEFTGDSQKEVDEKINAAQESVSGLGLKTHVTKTEDEAKKYWTIRRESFNLLRKHVKNRRTAPFIDDIIVSHDRLADFLPRLNFLMDQYELIYTIAGHVGDANFHIIPLMNFKEPQTKRTIFELSEKVFDLVLEFGGSITAEHNDGLIRSPYLEKMYGPEVYRLFEEVKKIFDPGNIFNPGKKVGASLDYAKGHLEKE